MCCNPCHSFVSHVISSLCYIFPVTYRRVKQKHRRLVCVHPIITTIPVYVSGEHYASLETAFFFFLNVRYCCIVMYCDFRWVSSAY